jgi:hypothetical protein
MLITTSCPKCGNGLKAPDHLAGRRVKCLRCAKLFTLPGAGGTAEPPAPPADRPEAGRPVLPTERAGTAAVRLAFWLGLVSLTAGLAACVGSCFPGTAGWCRTAGWLGLLLGGGAVILSIFREDCGFGCPFAGSAASLLALAMVAAGLGAPGKPGAGRPPGWAGRGPTFRRDRGAAGPRDGGLGPPPGPSR